MLSILKLNSEKYIIVAEIHCVPAVETAGYVFLCASILKYNPWFQPRGNVLLSILKFNSEKYIILAEIRFVPAVETAGYVFFTSHYSI